MLLQQLVRYRPAAEMADEDTRPYSRIRQVKWILDIDRHGRFRGLIPLADPSDRQARFGQSRLIPNAARTVGIAPAIGADDIQYVLGWADATTRPERVADAHAAFVALCRRWSTEHPTDAVATAVTAFYAQHGPDGVSQPERWSSKDIVVISVDGRPVTDSDSLWQVWKGVVEVRKSGGGNDGGRQGVCLVCGTTGTLLNRMPQALPKALVPRAEQEVALVSANKPIHTYDFNEGLGTAPICVDCGQAAVANLHTILDDRDHTFTYERQRSRMAWWVTHGGDDQTIALLDQNPSAISDYFDHLQRSQPPRRLGEHHLCSITLSGNVARLVVHEWIDQPLANAEANVHRWFADQAVVHLWRDGLVRFPIWMLVDCSGQWQPASADGRGQYIAKHDKAADRPDDLAQMLLHAALSNGGLPPHLLAHVVRRIRTDAHLDATRAALLRVTLSRYPNRTVEVPMPGLNPTSTDVAYISGRLFATLEATQRAAYPREEQPNTTFFDRHFSGAVTSPRIASIQGAQLWSAWIRKIRSSADREHTPDGRSRRLAVAAALTNRLTELFALLPAQALPARITTEDQSLFILGYYHQRAHDLAQARAGRAPEIATDGPPADPTTPTA